MGRAFVAVLFAVIVATPTVAAPLMGVYPCCSHLADPVIASEVQATDNAIRDAGSRLALLGDFIALEADPSVATAGAEIAWQSGAVALINVMRIPGPDEKLRVLAFPRNAAEWAASNRFYGWAGAFAAWCAQGGGRYVYLAPFPEVNGAWTNYHDDPANFIEAFRKMRYVFWQVGAPLGSCVRFVFAPDGNDPALGLYSPGPGWTDAAGVSAFSDGTCGGGDDFRSYDRSVGSALRSLRTAVTPGTPLFVTQTGVGPGPADMREFWTRALIDRARDEPGLVGIVYFNRWSGPAGVGCDYSLTPEAWRRVLTPGDRR